MKNGAAPLRLGEPGVYENTVREGDTVLLTLSLRWPRLEGDGAGVKRVNRYYETLADRWRRRWEGPLLAEARAQAGPDTPPWEVTLNYTVTLLEKDLFSLYLDAAEHTGQRRPRRVRQGDTWRFPAGVPVTLRELLPYRRWWRGNVLAEIRRQVGAQLQAGETLYREDWLSLCSRRFSPGRFYLTGQGPVVFYPVGSIAHALEGFPTFSLAALTEKI